MKQRHFWFGWAHDKAQATWTGAPARFLRPAPSQYESTGHRYVPFERPR